VTRKPNPAATWALVVGTLVVWGVFDLWAFVARRVETISGVFGWAFSWPWVGWWLCGAFGFVCGHLLGMTDAAAPGYWWRVAAVPLAAAAVGFALTRWPL
jgi:hypothetical protein